MAKNELSKEFNGFVVYETNTEATINLTNILVSPVFETHKYQVAEEDQISSIGFVPVIELDVNSDGEILQEESYVHSVGKFDVIKIKQSKRKVPASEVKKIVSSKIKKAIAEAQERGEELKINKDLKDMFKEEAVKELLPRCFVDEYSTYVFFDKEAELLYVVVPSHKKAEELTSLIRRVLGSLPINPLTTEKDITNSLTSFVTAQIKDELTLGNFVQMEDEEGIVAWKKESLYNSDAVDVIENSEKRVTKLGLNYDGVLGFIIDNDYVFSGLKFESYVTADSSGFSSSFLLMANEISGSVKALLKELDQE